MPDDSNKLINLTPSTKDFSYWSDRFQRRQEEYQETAEVPVRYVQKELPATSNIVFIGDTHVGSPESNYKRLQLELETIVKTPNTYVILMGDIVDGFFFNPAQFEQIEQVPEQYQFMEEIIRYLSSNQKLLLGLSGDHDNWSKKMGISAYREFQMKTGVPYIRGISYLEIFIEGISYKLSIAHRWPGHSLYNKIHSELRAERFGGARGSDIIIGAHHHQKGISMEAIPCFGGVSNMVYYLSLGAYKSTDDYAQKHGWEAQTPNQMFGSAVVLNAKEKYVMPYYDILKACESISKQ